MIDEPKIGCFEKRANPFFRRMSKELADLAKNNPELLRSRLSEMEQSGASWPVPIAYTRKLSKSRKALMQDPDFGEKIPAELLNDKALHAWRTRHNRGTMPVYDHYTHKRDFAFMPKVDSPNFSNEAYDYFKAMSGSNAEVKIGRDSQEIGRFYKLLTGKEYAPPSRPYSIALLQGGDTAQAYDSFKNTMARYAGVPASSLSGEPVGQYGAERFGEMLFTPHLADPIPSLNFIRGKEGLPQLAKESENWIHSMPYSAGKGDGTDASSWFAREVLRTSGLDVAGKGNWPKDLFKDVTRTVDGQKYKGRFYETVLPQSKTDELNKSLQSLFYLSNTAPKNIPAVKVSDLFASTNGKPLLFKGGSNSMFISPENDGKGLLMDAFKQSALSRMSKEQADQLRAAFDNKASGWWLTPNIRTAIDYSGAPAIANGTGANAIDELYAITVPKSLRGVVSDAMHAGQDPKQTALRVLKAVRSLREDGQVQEADLLNDMLQHMLKRMKEMQ